MSRSDGSFKAFLSYAWQWYLLIAAAIAGIDYGIYSLAHTPKRENTLSLFVACQNMESQRLENDLFEANFQDSPIEKVAVDYSDPDGFYFNLVFSTRGVTNTDIVLLPSHYLGEESYPTYFVPLDETVVADYIGETLSWTDYEDIHYGMGIGDRLSLYGIQGDYYAFLNKKSGKIGCLGEDSQNDYALWALRWIYA